MPDEATNQQQGKALLEALGFHVSDFAQGYRPGRSKRHRTTRQTKGIPDTYCVHPEKRFRVWIEWKADAGKLSPDQEAWHALHKRAGAHVWTCHSVPELVNLLNSYGWRIREAGHAWLEHEVCP